MLYNYQLILLGEKHPLESCLLLLFFKRLKELGINKRHVVIIRSSNFEQIYRGNAPAYCLYFGNAQEPTADLKIVERVKKEANTILPVVDQNVDGKAQIPELLRYIHRFELTESSQLEQLVNRILEGFSLLRQSRNVFISYRRKEATGIAIQLFEQLERHGFNIFLDTHSIQHGDDFQAELWHRMVDTDLVIVLNTPGFLESTWTKKEFAKANALSIGILQLIWPETPTEKATDLTTVITLTKDDFKNQKFDKANGKLKTNILKEAVKSTESMRARNLAARQDNIITEFIDSANKHNVQADLQPEKVIQVKDVNGQDHLIIPTVGVPQSFNYSDSHELIKKIESVDLNSAYILFDHRNIREKWIQHLDWLDDHLPVRTLKTTNIEQWMKKH